MLRAFIKVTLPGILVAFPATLPACQEPCEDVEYTTQAERLRAECIRHIDDEIARCHANKGALASKCLLHADEIRVKCRDIGKDEGAT